MKREEREKRRREEKLRVPQFFSSDELQSGRSPDALTRTVRVRATVVYPIPVAHGRLAVPTTSAVAEAGKVNILFVEMNVPKMQQASEEGAGGSSADVNQTNEGSDNTPRSSNNGKAKEEEEPTVKPEYGAPSPATRAMTEGAGSSADVNENQAEGNRAPKQRKKRA